MTRRAATWLPYKAFASEPEDKDAEIRKPNSGSLKSTVEAKVSPGEDMKIGIERTAKRFRPLKE